jgi:RND family efflux transporter MFP subunit
MKPLAIVFALLVILAILTTAPKLVNWSEIKTLADDHQIPEVSILVAKAERKPISLTLPSTLYPMRTTPIWARVDGYLDNFYVDIGDPVVANQVIATIETPELDKQLLQARADRLNAVARLDIAKISADRWKALYQKNTEAVPLQEVDQRTADYQAALASVEAADANVERLEKLVGFKTILAPFSGIITERPIDKGSLITAGSAGNPQQLFVISQIDVLRVFVNVPQTFFRLIQDGQQTQVVIQEFSQPFIGVVARTAGALDQTARTLLTEVHVDNKEGLLTSGLFANVTFTLSPKADYFIVPTKSLIIINDGPKVAILDRDNIVRVIPVEIGRDWGKTIEITNGIKEDDRVITNPSYQITEGKRAAVGS